MFRWPWIVINSYNKTNQMHLFLKFIFGIKLYMFRTVPLSIIRSFSLHTQQWCMSYRFADSCSRTKPFPSWSCSQAVNKPVWHKTMLCVQWKTPDDGQRNCPKHVVFYSKNKFGELVRPVSFIIRTNQSIRSNKATIRQHKTPYCRKFKIGTLYIYIFGAATQRGLWSPHSWGF